MKSFLGNLRSIFLSGNEWSSTDYDKIPDERKRIVAMEADLAFKRHIAVNNDFKAYKYIVWKDYTGRWLRKTLSPNFIV